jgi:hypothetical protein
MTAGPAMRLLFNSVNPIGGELWLVDERDRNGPS